MKDNKEWKTNVLILQLAMEINLPQEIRQLRSNTATHYLIFPNHVYQALIKLKNNGCVQRIKKSTYKMTFVGLKKISNSYFCTSSNIPKSILNNIVSKGMLVSNIMSKSKLNNLVPKNMLASNMMPKSKLNNLVPKNMLASSIMPKSKLNNLVPKNMLVSSIMPKSKLNNLVPKNMLASNMMPKSMLDNLVPKNMLASSIMPKSKLNNLTPKVTLTNNIIPKQLFNVNGTVSDAIRKLNKGKVGSKISLNLKPAIFPKLRVNNVARAAILRPEFYWNKYLKNVNSMAGNAINIAQNSQAVVGNFLEKVIDFNLKNTNLRQLEPLINRLSLDGWCITEEKDLRLLFLSDDKSIQDIIKRKEKLYSDTKTIQIFKEIIQNSFFGNSDIDAGRKTMLKDILTVLESDYNKFYLFFSDLFSMCEYVFFEKLHTFFQREKNYLDGHNLNDMNNLVEKLKEKTTLSLRILRFYSTIKVMKKYWHYRPHNSFGRDPVQHGFYDPDKMKKTDFSKIVLLLYSILKLNGADDILNDKLQNFKTQ